MAKVTPDDVHRDRARRFEARPDFPDLIASLGRVVAAAAPVPERVLGSALGVTVLTEHTFTGERGPGIGRVNMHSAVLLSIYEVRGSDALEFAFTFADGPDIERAAEQVREAGISVRTGPTLLKRPHTEFRIDGAHNLDLALDLDLFSAVIRRVARPNLTRRLLQPAAQHNPYVVDLMNRYLEDERSGD